MLQKKSRDINFTTKAAAAAAAEPAFKLFPAFWEVLISKLFRILFSPCACLQPAPQHHSHAAAIIENIII